MVYDFVRWGAVLLLFAVLSLVIWLITKKIMKSVFVSASVSVVVCAVLLLVPVENLFYSFGSVERAYTYRYHEPLVAYAECAEGALCAGERTGENDVYYSFPRKDDNGYQMPGLNDNVQIRSSKFGVYIIKKFDTQTLIMTRVENSRYDYGGFKSCDGGYYYYVVEGDFVPSQLSCENEHVTLV